MLRTKTAKELMVNRKIKRIRGLAVAKGHRKTVRGGEKAKEKKRER